MPTLAAETVLTATLARFFQTLADRRSQKSPAIKAGLCISVTSVGHRSNRVAGRSNRVAARNNREAGRNRRVPVGYIPVAAHTPVPVGNKPVGAAVARKPVVAERKPVVAGHTPVDPD